MSNNTFIKEPLTRLIPLLLSKNIGEEEKIKLTNIFNKLNQNINSYDYDCLAEYNQKAEEIDFLVQELSKNNLEDMEVENLISSIKNIIYEEKFIHKNKIIIGNVFIIEHFLESINSLIEECNLKILYQLVYIMKELLNHEDYPIRGDILDKIFQIILNNNIKKNDLNKILDLFLEKIVALSTEENNYICRKSIKILFYLIKNSLIKENFNSINIIEVVINYIFNKNINIEDRINTLINLQNYFRFSKDYFQKVEKLFIKQILTFINNFDIISLNEKDDSKKQEIENKFKENQRLNSFILIYFFHKIEENNDEELKELFRAFSIKYNCQYFKHDNEWFCYDNYKHKFLKVPKSLEESVLELNTLFEETILATITDPKIEQLQNSIIDVLKQKFNINSDLEIDKIKQCNNFERLNNFLLDIAIKDKNDSIPFSKIE